MSNPADDFAALLGITPPPADETPASQPAEPTRRRPRPDPTQGSGSNGPTALPASARFADWISRLPLGNGSGNWRQVDR
jgi:hypothetical protein